MQCIRSTGETSDCSLGVVLAYNPKLQTDIISVRAKMQLWFYLNILQGCLFLCCESYDFAKPGVQLARPPGLKNSKTHSLSYLKCRLTYYACGQAWNLDNVKMFLGHLGKFEYGLEY